MSAHCTTVFRPTTTSALVHKSSLVHEKPVGILVPANTVGKDVLGTTDDAGHVQRARREERKNLAPTSQLLVSEPESSAWSCAAAVESNSVPTSCARAVAGTCKSRNRGWQSSCLVLLWRSRDCLLWLGVIGDDDDSGGSFQVKRVLYLPRGDLDGHWDHRIPLVEDWK
ncbi:hypothetical protein BDV41DRAFT_579775 [Aspergillus transmontanensis]|uniref:Uncharacterized protein n=1 Tax=Aspergillus transmontanensis TaxID=1034304 RepID=A0A5N6VP94_9EURO|nr:hypothetical protein BDV41DRAFT_579775 [Aspergillus transmontanensis]